MILRWALSVVLLAGLVFTAADDSETERNVAELEVETLVSSDKFSPPQHPSITRVLFLQEPVLFIHHQEPLFKHAVQPIMHQNRAVLYCLTGFQ